MTREAAAKKNAPEQETKEDNPFLLAGEGADKEHEEMTAEVIDFPKGRVSGGQPEPYDVDADKHGEINDADIFGPEPKGFGEFLARPATFLIGKMYGAKDRRNTQDGDWEAVTMPWMAWIEGGAKKGAKPAWGFSRHPVGKIKEGFSIVLGSSIEGARKANAMDEMFALGLDIDSGASLDDVVATIRRKNLFALIYTSHSHGKCGLEIKRDDVLRKLGIKEDPTLAQVQEYLRAHSKSRYEESFIEAVTIADPKKQTSKGVKIVLTTPPLDKFRIIFPLETPVKLIDLAATQQEALEVWEDKITGMAWEELGVHFDTSCSDPSRLFYTARHAEDAEWDCLILRGDPLRFEDVPTMKKADYTRKRDVAGAGRKVDRYFTENGVDLNSWYNENAEQFEFSDFLEAMVPDKIRKEIGEGFTAFECPFESGHSEEGGDGFAVVNASAATKERGTASCKHDSCQGRKNAEFIAEMLDKGWFTEEELFDPDGMHLLEPGEEVSGTAGQQDSQVPASAGTPEERCAAFGDKSKADEIEEFLTDLYKEGVDVTDRARVTDALAENTVLGKRDLNKMWSKLDRVQAKIDKDAAKAEADDAGVIMIDGDFLGNCGKAQDAIDARNTADPFLFVRNGVLCVIEPQDGIAAVNLIKSTSAYAYYLNTTARFAKRQGSEGGFVGASAPIDVLAHLFYAPKDRYPTLDKVTTTPFFSATGELVTEPGYHADTRTYYHPGDFVVPGVSRSPTKQEMKDALNLLVGLVAEFPFAGITDRDTMLERFWDKEAGGVPALVHFLSALLTMFARDLFGRIAPGLLINKPEPGTGASLLVDLFAIITTGRTVGGHKPSRNEQEFAKALAGFIMDGRPITYFDNIDFELDSADLAAAQTAERYSPRALGGNDVSELDVSTMFIITANGLVMSGELLRRSLLSDLDPKRDDPENRGGFVIEDPKEHVKENRADYVHAALTVIQYWVSEGMPKGDKKLASFEAWSHNLSGLWGACGVPGFMGNEAVKTADLADNSRNDVQVFAEALTAAALKTAKQELGYEIRVTKDGGTEFTNVLDVLHSFTDDPIKFPKWGWVPDPALEGAVKYTSPRTVSPKFSKMVQKTFTVRIKLVEGRPTVAPDGIPYSVTIVEGRNTSANCKCWWLNVSPKE